MSLVVHDAHAFVVFMLVLLVHVRILTHANVDSQKIVRDIRKQEVGGFYLSFRKDLADSEVNTFSLQIVIYFYSSRVYDLYAMFVD